MRQHVLMLAAPPPPPQLNPACSPQHTTTNINPNHHYHKRTRAQPHTATQKYIDFPLFITAMLVPYQ
jgi:hypothetical protein